ncbi:MAG: metal ABC transporter permease [Caldilineaceae bacterium]
MNPFDLLQSIFTDYTIRTVALGTLTLGVVSGALGTFAVLRKQALMGDAMSHAALPGVVLAFMLTGQKSPAVLTLGAALAGLAGVLLIVITRYTRQTGQFAGHHSVGLLRLRPHAAHLFAAQPRRAPGGPQQLSLRPGRHAAHPRRGRHLALFGGAALLLMLLFWKEFKLCSALTGTTAPAWVFPCNTWNC